jgi:FkbH-like protein
MRLSEALAVVNNRKPEEMTVFRTALVCGFTPLHLRTFLSAHLQLVLPQHCIEVHTGLYGDLLGNLERSASEPADAYAIAIEWADLDARLGIRGLGGWCLTDFQDVLESVRSRLTRIEDLIGSISQRCRLAICLPTLPLPPIQTTVRTWNTGPLDLELRQLLSSFALRVTKNENVAVISGEWLDRISPHRERFDVKSELLTGFPYSLVHADAVAEILANLIQSPAPKKGLITDLDNTLWKGILGEVGVDQVCWDLDHKAHQHALYQAMLRSLASSGILVAVASKNDPAAVERAFERTDLILTKDLVFPFEVHWNPKSQSVDRILQAWNIGPESVVFVDDSPAELAEVQAAHPQIECLLFPTDPNGVYELLLRLRNLFAKGRVTEEDRLRLASIRSMNYVRDELQTAPAVNDMFLEQAESELTLSFSNASWDPRALELLNKTNQFNLNGKRYTEAAFRTRMAEQDTFVLKASYKDKYGPLGKIAVIAGRKNGNELHVDAWVMSCRAFSRRIEHQCLDHLFRRFQADQIHFDYLETPKNKPLQDFFASINGQRPESALCLSRDVFLRNCPRVFHQVREE